MISIDFFLHLFVSKILPQQTIINEVMYYSTWGYLQNLQLPYLLAMYSTFTLTRENSKTVTLDIMDRESGTIGKK